MQEQNLTGGMSVEQGSCIVRVVIQHTVSLLYLKEGNCWTSLLSEALDFGYFENAALFALEQRLTNIQVAVAFTATGQIYIFPVRHPKDRP